jgi:hypothetical protein
VVELEENDMKIKYKKIISFRREVSTTRCPYGHNAMVESKPCTLCNFYIRPHVFSDAITCSYDKAKKRGQIEEDKDMTG